MTTIDETHLIGIALPHKTTNLNGQSNKDCGALWQKFESEKIFEKIPGKLDNEVIAVYHEYDGDHMKPFAYFIGCRVKEDQEVPDELSKLIIPKGSYNKHVAKGKMPECIGQAWAEIWQSETNRSFTADFEVYGQKSYDWNNAEVNIFLSVKHI